MSTGTDNSAQNNGEQKVVFTPEQQARMQEIIDAAVGRAGAPHKQAAQQLEQEKTALQSQLADLQSQLEAAKASGKSGSKDEAETLRAQIAEMKNAQSRNADEATRLKQQLDAERQEAVKAKTEALNVRKSVAIQRAASEVNFVNNEVVEKLTDAFVKWDETKGGFVVVNESGQPRMNAAYEPMSLSEYYQEFAAKNPYLVRSDVRPGVGSTQSGRFDVSRDGKLEVKQVFGKESNSRLAMELKKSNPAEYARLKVIAKDSGLIG
jgi:hypothetical protein